MHAAAERARKRREEEEQKRLEQTERARKKAQELEEKMKAAEEAKAKEKREKEEAARPPPKERRPSVAAAQSAPPVAPADKATSWRAAAKPLPSQAAAASAAAAGRALTGASSRSQTREHPSVPAAAPLPAAEPTSILPRPSASSSAPAAQQEPAQPAAWRRPSAPAAAAAAAAPPPPPPVEAVPPPSAETAKPTTPPPPPSLALLSPPTSPSQDRKRQDPAAAVKHGYKLPAVSQFDDLMSRIKGVMAQPSEADDAHASSSKDEAGPADASAAKGEAVAAAEATDAVAVPVEVPTVKLPPRTRASKAAARAAAAAAAHALAQQQQLVVSLPPPTEPRGRGRARADAPRLARQAAPIPAFESREPVLPYHSSRIARSQSPPPAWRQYTIRLAAQPPRRPVAARVLKNFTNPGFPKPLYPFSWEPVLKDVNPRRLNRDDMLLPKKYDKHGMPIYVVALPKRRFSARSSAAEPKVEPEIVVSISHVALVRQVAPEPAAAAPLAAAFEPAQPVAAGHVVDAGFAPFSGKSRGDGRASEASAAWRRDGGEGAVGAAPFALGGANGQEAKFTGALNGEKIEGTPRKVTTAPGRDANGLSKVRPLFSRPFSSAASRRDSS